MNIALVEDDKIYSKQLFNELIKVFQNETIHVFYDGESFLQSNKKYDLILLDIELPGINGIKISKMRKSDTYVIFLTSLTDYVYDAFGENVLGYLIKTEPITTVVKKVKKLIDEVYTKNNIEIRTKEGKVNVNLDKIIKCTLEKRKLYFYTSLKEIQVLDYSLSEIYMLVKDKFIYTNRSTLVNAKKIVDIKNDLIYLENNLTASLSRKCMKEFKDEWLEKVL